VTTESLDTACYRDLGEVDYAQPFSDAVIDADHNELAQQLRKTAQKKYTNQVGAVIAVHGSENELGTAVVASGEAVQFEHEPQLSCAVPRAMRSTLMGLAFNPLGRAGGREPGAGSTDTGSQGPEAAGPTGIHKQMGAKGILQRVIKSKMSAQTEVSEQTLIDQMHAQDAEIRGLQKQLQASVRSRCQETDISVSRCAAAEKAAVPDEAPPALIGSTNYSGDESLIRVALENRVQAQQEIISRLREEIADMKSAPEKAGVTPSSSQSAAPESGN
jgi:hypothetical protein